jgi:hypothetical protein
MRTWRRGNRYAIPLCTKRSPWSRSPGHSNGPVDAFGAGAGAGAGAGGGTGMATGTSKAAGAGGAGGGRVAGLGGGDTAASSIAGGATTAYAGGGWGGSGGGGFAMKATPGGTPPFGGSPLTVLKCRRAGMAGVMAVWIESS